VGGLVYMRYADGRLDTVFPFTGTVAADGTTAAITVTGPPTVVTGNGTVTYVQANVQPGDQLSATLSNQTVTMVGCTNYLHFLSDAEGPWQNQISGDPDICNFYYIGGEYYPSVSQTPITPASPN